MDYPGAGVYKRDFMLLAAFSVLLYLLVLFFNFKGGFYWDILCWQDWTKIIMRTGIGKAYEGTGINYNPGFLYVLKLFGEINGSTLKVEQNISYLRQLVILFDFAGVFLFAWLLRKNNISPLYSCFLLLNVAYLYNTLLWGQVDSLHTFFAAASLAALIYKKPVMSVVLMVLSLNIKLQGIIFIPLAGILILPYFIANKKIILYCLFVAILTQLVILLPFILQHQLKSVWVVNINAVDFYPKISMNAFNFWYLIINGDLSQLTDASSFYGFSYKRWGLLLFVLTSGLALFPILIRTLNLYYYKENFKKKDVAMICLVAGLITLSFFYFNTQMHERYSHPALLFIAIYAFLCKDYFIYVVVSLAYLLNMEKVLKYLELNNYDTLIFEPVLVSVLFLIVMAWGYYRLLTGYKLKIDLKLLAVKTGAWKIATNKG